jgi:hypothetical protein
MSSVFAGPPFIVDGPLPVPPPHRLIDVATRIQDGGDPHWRNGATVWAYNCGTPSGIAPCLTGTFALKAEGVDNLLPEFGAFTAYFPISCTARSIGDEQAFIDRLVSIFRAVESFPVEQQLASGTSQPLNPFLTDANVDVVTGGATDAACALALLEDAIGETARAGLIHVTPAIATALAAAYLIETRSNRLWTARGTEVVVGDGYIGASPGAAPADGTGYMFATGPVNYYSGEVVLVPGTIKEALDRSDNTVTFLAERDYLVYWDTCLQAAALVDFCP